MLKIIFLFICNAMLFALAAYLGPIANHPKWLISLNKLMIKVNLCVALALLMWTAIYGI